MSENINNILFVCKANFCRSPVAENLLKFQLKNDDINIESRGLIDYFEFDMHKYSREYLSTKTVNPNLTSPKKIANEDLKRFDIIFAMDLEIFSKLQKKYKNYSSKIFLFTKFSKKYGIKDPIGSNKEDYFKSMDSIYEEILEIEKFLDNKIK